MVVTGLLYVLLQFLLSEGFWVYSQTGGLYIGDARSRL